MRSLFNILESILSTDKEVQSQINTELVLKQIKNIMLEMYGSSTDPKSYNKWMYVEDTYSIVFQFNLDKDNFSDKFRKFINRLNKIDSIDLNWHIVKSKNVFKKSSRSDRELYEVKIFLDDEIVLEFWVDDLFVNYGLPAAGLGLSFIFKSKYKQFFDMFEGPVKK